MAKPTNTLSPEAVQLLQGQTVVILNLADKANDRIYTSALSWVYGIDEKTIRFAVDHKSEIIEIIENDPRLKLTFFGLESVYTISGQAVVKVRKTEGLTLKLAIIEVNVEEVRDIIFYGGKIVANPAFEKTYAQDLIVKLDNEVKGAIFNLYFDVSIILYSNE